MPIPPSIFARIIQMVVRSSKSAFKGSALIRKKEVKKIGNYLIHIKRRSELGIDGGISQIVKIFKNGNKEEIWHIVIKAGKVIHKHLLK